MRAFLIRPDDTHWGAGRANNVDAARLCCMPGLSCPTCGDVWSTTGPAYPSITCAQLGGLASRLTSAPIDSTAFGSLVEEVARVIGRDRELMPGTGFGPLIGAGRGEVADFVWTNPWTVLTRGSAKAGMERVLERALCGAFADIRWADSQEDGVLYEIEAWPTARLAATPETACGTCGRLATSRREDLVIRADSLDETAGIQRIRELPTRLVISGALAELVMAENYSNLAVEEITVAR